MSETTSAVSPPTANVTATETTAAKGTAATESLTATQILADSAPARPRLEFQLEIPLRRADLPALALIAAALLPIGWWIWANFMRIDSTTAAPAGGAVEPLIASLLHEWSITLPLTLAATLLILAVALALSPLRWWAHTRLLTSRGLGRRLRQLFQHGAEPEDAEAWVAALAALESEQQRVRTQGTTEKGTSEERTTAAGSADEQIEVAASAEDEVTATEPDVVVREQPTSTSEQATASTPEQGATDEAQQPTTDEAGAQQPAAQGSAADQQRAEQEGTEQEKTAGEANGPQAEQPKQQGAPQAKQQPTSALADLADDDEDEESLDLGDLTDVEDILSSFTDSDEISPHLLALSASVAEIDIRHVAEHAHTVAKELQTAEAPVR